jgi:hypothetical protein
LKSLQEDVVSSEKFDIRLLQSILLAQLAISVTGNLFIIFSLYLQENLNSKVESLPTKKDFDVCMKWPQFESALKSGTTGVDLSSNVSGTEVASEDTMNTLKQLGSIVNGHETVLENILRLQVKYFSLHSLHSQLINQTIVEVTVILFVRKQCQQRLTRKIWKN